MSPDAAVRPRKDHPMTTLHPITIRDVELSEQIEQRIHHARTSCEYGDLFALRIQLDLLAHAARRLPERLEKRLLDLPVD